ncbi:putative mitochondrial carrier protein [Corchorus olitorius]|uniref:Mitochondrial carrier protein n=1 Tax=Corchorus olitorius TaxID=93759 RepID=A0A1R3L3E4_9ROSI|nr:putative mitochondrial carrier protein [Corchorus olitorius]
MGFLTRTQNQVLPAYYPLLFTCMKTRKADRRGIQEAALALGVRSFIREYGVQPLLRHIAYEKLTLPIAIIYTPDYESINSSAVHGAPIGSLRPNSKARRIRVVYFTERRRGYVVWGKGKRPVLNQPVAPVSSLLRPLSCKFRYYFVPSPVSSDMDSDKPIENGL